MTQVKIKSIVSRSKGEDSAKSLGSVSDKCTVTTEPSKSMYSVSELCVDPAQTGSIQRTNKICVGLIF